MSERNLHPDIDRMLGFMKEHVKNITGHEQAAGIQIAALIRILSNQYEQINQPGEGEEDLSGPRLGLLIRLMESERRGSIGGITPSELSRNQHVTRNTISALLRGLEDQGLIERQLDQSDRRLFRIHLTQAGRDRVKATAPQRITQANQVVSGLTPEEQEQLVFLLSKLFVSLHQHCDCPANQSSSRPESTN